MAFELRFVTLGACFAQGIDEHRCKLIIWNSGNNVSYLAPQFEYDSRDRLNIKITSDTLESELATVLASVRYDDLTNDPNFLGASTSESTMLPSMCVMTSWVASRSRCLQRLHPNLLGTPGT
jgi:hypothetical protein